MSLEVGEHLPQEFENIFIHNLHNNNKSGILLSWAIKGQGDMDIIMNKIMIILKQKYANWVIQTMLKVKIN